MPKSHGSNFYAEEGTAAHELGDYVLVNPDISLASQIGRKFNGIEVTKEMTKAVEKYIEYIDEAMEIDTEAWFESKVPMSYLKKGQFGTADAILIFNPDTSNFVMEVIDYKHGRGHAVEAIGNHQMRHYACGTLEHLFAHGIKFNGFDTVKVTIVQPRAPHPEGHVRSDFFSINELRAFRKEAQDAMHEAEGDNPSFGPSEDNCMWCAAKPVCKHFAEYNLQVARMEFLDLSEPVEPKELFERLPKKDFMSKEELMYVYNNTKAFTQWLKAIGDFVRETMMSGEKYGDLKLVRGRSNRSWRSEDQVLKAFSKYIAEHEESKLKKDDLYTKKLMSPNQIETNLPDEVMEAMVELVYKPEGKVTVAHKSDKRTAIDSADEAAKDWEDEI